MPELRYRSRSYKRIFKKTPGGRTVIHYRRKNHQSMSVPDVENHYMVFPGKTLRDKETREIQKRPNRPYGGYYCSSCARKVFKREARS